MCCLDPAVEGDVLAEIKFLSDEIQIAQRIRLGGEVFRPFPFLQQFFGKRIAIGPALGIETRARVAVPIPSAADIRARLKYPELHAEFAQANKLIHAGDTSPDDDYIRISGD